METQSTTFDHEDQSRMNFDPPTHGEDLSIHVGHSDTYESIWNPGSKLVNHEEDVGDADSYESNL